MLLSNENRRRGKKKPTNFAHIHLKFKNVMEFNIKKLIHK